MHPHGAYVRGARRNRIDRHGVELNGSQVADCKDFVARAKRPGWGTGFWVLKAVGSHGEGIKIVDGVAPIV